MELWIGAVNLGFLYSFMALGIFITYKIYDFADITVDGSFTTGAAVSSVLIIAGMNPFLSIVFAFFGSAAAGMLTGLIHTRFKVNGLLSGILVMTGLYSINLRIMEKSNIPLLNSPTFISIIEKYNPGFNNELWICIFLIALMIVFWVIFSAFFKTDFGVTMRATGNNEIMVAANGVNVNWMKVFGIALANGLVGISGGFVAQYQGFSDIGMGVGAVVFSLASVIIGEAIIKRRSIFLRILSVILGSIIFRIMVALALYIGLNPNDLKLITAIFVLLTLVISGAFSSKKYLSKVKISNFWSKYKKTFVIASVVVVVAIAGYIVNQFLLPGKSGQKKVKIGLIIASDAEILTVTRDGLIDELKKLGYENGKNIEIIEQNANGDIPTVSSIVDNFINQKVDIYIPISTASTQAAVKKIKDKPVIFATVANPFIIGVGKSNTDHPANVTGIYGSAPIKEMLGMARMIFPGNFNVGCMWNAAFPNSVFNSDLLQNAVKEQSGVKLTASTIASTQEVYQTAQALAGKGIDAFFLVPDLHVFASFESIVKASKSKKIPIFTGDVEKLASGALLTYGYEYYSSGVQAANIIDRIIKGESVANIPYEGYKHTRLGVNLDVANEYKIKIPQQLIDSASFIYENGKLVSKKELLPSVGSSSGAKKLAIFQFTHNVTLDETTRGIMDELNNSRILKEKNITVDIKNANSDFGIGQSIAKEMVSKNYDYIISVSTITLQATAANNTKIPHVFCAVTDPVKAGVAKTFTDHKPNLTGLATPQPVNTTIKLMRQMFPQAKKIGMLWNPSEVNSEFCTMAAREACKQNGFSLIEKTVSATNEIESSLQALLHEKPDIFYTAGDITVETAVPAIAKTLLKNKIPYFSNSPGHLKFGTLAAIGADYYSVGVKAAKLACRVINGQSTASIPIEKYVPEQLFINNATAKNINIKISDAILKNATKVIN
jgi:putative ABC transport system permease protein